MVASTDRERLTLAKARADRIRAIAKRQIERAGDPETTGPGGARRRSAWRSLNTALLCYSTGLRMGIKLFDLPAGRLKSAPEFGDLDLPTVTLSARSTLETLIKCDEEIWLAQHRLSRRVDEYLRQ